MVKLGWGRGGVGMGVPHETQTSPASGKVTRTQAVILHIPNVALACCPGLEAVIDH